MPLSVARTRLLRGWKFRRPTGEHRMRRQHRDQVQPKGHQLSYIRNRYSRAHTNESSGSVFAYRC